MSDGTKVCKKCGKESPLSEFGKKVSHNGVTYYNGVCKKCKAEQIHEYYEKNKAVIIENKHKYYKENNTEILNKKKDYWSANKENLKVSRKVYYSENKEKINEACHNYYVNNKEKVKDTVKNYVNTEKGRSVRRQANSKYIKTEKGKQVRCKVDAKRRSLGVNPINNYFIGSHYHHLRHKKETGIIDNDIGLYIPKEVHESVPHNGNNGYNMDKINKLAIEWYINSTRVDKLNSCIFDLCKVYNVKLNN